MTPPCRTTWRLGAHCVGALSGALPKEDPATQWDTTESSSCVMPEGYYWMLNVPFGYFWIVSLQGVQTWMVYLQLRFSCVFSSGQICTLFLVSEMLLFESSRPDRWSKRLRGLGTFMDCQQASRKWTRKKQTLEIMPEICLNYFNWQGNG